MLTPQELLEIVDTMYPLLDGLNAWITTDIIQRLMACMNRGEALSFGATDKWQLQLYQSAAGHYEALEKQIKEWTRLSDAEVKAIFEDAGIRAWSADDAFYVEQGYESTPLLKSESLMNVLTDAYQRTNGEIHNFTRTTATRSEQRFIDVCDKAHLKVVTGAQSYTAAVKEAVDELAGQQLSVTYPSGHTDTIETAVLRCVRTGTAQASGNLTLQGMVERELDIILASAHLGARYGDNGENPSNHFWWQGKLYSREGKTPGLPDFVTCTGYGTGEGLCGWNCRHSFGPGNLGHNPYKEFDSEENKRVYDLTQKQRRMEAAIRRSQAKLIGYQTAINGCEDEQSKSELQQDYDKLAQRLSAQNKTYNSFCAENGLTRYDDRLQAARWNRQEAVRAAKASAQAKKDVENSTGDGIIREKIANNKLSTKLSLQHYKKHIAGTVEFENYRASRAEKGQTPQSILTVSKEEAQELILKHCGTGVIQKTKAGKFRDVEYCNADRVIGKYFRDNEYFDTVRFAIHYSKRDAHIVPVKPEDN
jgi:hypothetical protein